MLCTVSVWMFRHIDNDHTTWNWVKLQSVFRSQYEQPSKLCHLFFLAIDFATSTDMILKIWPYRLIYVNLYLFTYKVYLRGKSVLLKTRTRNSFDFLTENPETPLLLFFLISQLFEASVRIWLVISKKSR